MAVFEEAEVNQDDQNLESSLNDASSSSEFSITDWYLCYESGNDENDVGEEGANFISDWVVSDDSVSDEDFPVTIASLSVGFVLSVKDKQVIIEGRGKHYLLSIGSFLWITETRDPLGYVDEVFGTVEKPCFSVSLKSESKVPEGIRQGTEVSLIVAADTRRGNKGLDASVFGDAVDEIEVSEDAECDKMENKEMASEEKMDDKVLDLASEEKIDNKVLDLGASSKKLEAEQALPSDSQTDPVIAQAIPETGGMETVTTVAAPVKSETNQPKRYQPPMVKQMGLTPTPVPTQTPERMIQPMRYTPKHLRNGQNNYINPQPAFGLHQRYQSGASWREMKPTHAFASHRPMQHIQPPMQPPPQYIQPTMQPLPLQSQRSNHRGGGTGFLGRGRELPQPR